MNAPVKPRSESAPPVAGRSAAAPGRLAHGDPWHAAGPALDAMDNATAAFLARATGGMSPFGSMLAYMDWMMHLSAAPGRQIALGKLAATHLEALAKYAVQGAVDEKAPMPVPPAPGDHRFEHPGWKVWPFRLQAASFLLVQDWWKAATSNLRGVSPHHLDMVSFAARQLIDMYSPSNLPWSNPEVLAAAKESGGRNFMAGLSNALEDARNNFTGKGDASADAFVPGKDVAITPGKIVFRDRLIELIQYSPTTETVAAEPVLIVPAWIMKYYILDLKPDDSFIRYLVSQGRTVFAISWKNVTAEDRDLGLDDYRTLGVMAALDVIGAIVGEEKRVHMVGYCLGGTLSAITAATMARNDDDRLASLTLLAAQTDFTEAGEINLFIDDSQVAFLEALMWDRGYLDAKQMAGAFQALRSNDLVWSKLIREYLLGQRPSLNDVMAWNADATRMPFRMHSEYLRRLFLRNELATGSYMVEGKPIAIQNIRVPILAVGTERDHVAPWHSVYKVHLLADTDVSFILASGGHNVGIVSPPTNKKAHHRYRDQPLGVEVLSPDEWLETVPERAGSWWPTFVAWLDDRSTGRQVTPPTMGAPDNGVPIVDEAPGIYVHGH
ncbi:PHA/PHB synthase family protein [Segnochrobactraceae bacterium EtOH-i3]